MTARRRAERERGGAPRAWRLDAGGETIAFVDRLHGVVERFVVDDFVVWRGDRTRAYNLPVVIDDAHQGIGEVVRGDDLLNSTTRQLLLARLLALPVPRVAHVPLVLGPDGRRLGKRHGAVTLPDRLALGETAETVGWMAWSLGLADSNVRLPATQLLARFTPEALSREATVFGQPPPR